MYFHSTELLLSLFILEVSAQLWPLMSPWLDYNSQQDQDCDCVHYLFMAPNTEPGVQSVIVELPMNYTYLSLFCLSFLKCTFNFLSLTWEKIWFSILLHLIEFEGKDFVTTWLLLILHNCFPRFFLLKVEKMFIWKLVPFFQNFARISFQYIMLCYQASI